MKLIKEHLDIGVEVWTKESSGYTHKDKSIPCRILGFNKNQNSVLIDNQVDGHSGSDDYFYDKKGKSLGKYDPYKESDKLINDRRYVHINYIERIAYSDLSKFIGRKIKSLVDRPCGGAVKAGEIGIIVDNFSVDFPSQTNYAISSEMFSNKDHLNKFELLPEDYKEEPKSDIKKDEKGRPLKEFVVGEWYTNPLSQYKEYKYARIKSCKQIFNDHGSKSYWYSSIVFDAFTNDFEELLMESLSMGNTNFEQKMEPVTPPPIKTTPKKVESNPFKIGDEVEFVSLDRDSVPKEIWSQSGGSFGISSEFSLNKSYKVERYWSPISVVLRGDNECTYTVPVMLLKKYEEKQEEVLKYFDGKPLVDVKPGWYINNTGQSGKKYVRVSHRNIQGPSSNNDYYQKVYYDAFTDNFIDIESKKPNYWANQHVNRNLVPISDKEIEEIKKKNTISTSVKMYDIDTPLKEFKIGEWYKSPWDYKDTKMQDGQNALYIKVSKVEVLSTNNGFFYNRVHFDRITRDFLHIESPSAGTGSWANGNFDVVATHIDERKIARMKEEVCCPKVTEECSLQTLEAKSWEFEDLPDFMTKRITKEEFDRVYKTGISYTDPSEEKTQEENLLDKYEHQVIKLSKPRTKNKLIIL